jgi:alpha-tubulin suppressor-like RCC1 family protein
MRLVPRWLTALLALAISTIVQAQTLEPLRDIKDISVGDFHACALTASGKVRCWGLNAQGQLGDTTFLDATLPRPAVALSRPAVAISTGGGQTCAILDNQSVSCWGWNAYGQLGDGTLVDRATPVAASASLGSIGAVAAGGAHTCAATSVGAVGCWGDNSLGALGDGTTASSTIATTTGGSWPNATAISVGNNHSCALRSTGLITCWGNNTNGQLGDGTALTKTLPVAVVSAESMISVSAGGFHSCATTASKYALCWGSNINSTLGDGTTVDRLVPTLVARLGANVQSVAAGKFHTCALSISGLISCWGNNGLGSLGNGTTLDSAIPVDTLPLGTRATKIASGQFVSCALLDNTTVKCWGDNSYGQLGDGSTLGRLAPVNVLDVVPPRPVPLNDLLSIVCLAALMLVTGTVTAKTRKERSVARQRNA